MRIFGLILSIVLWSTAAIGQNSLLHAGKIPSGGGGGGYTGPGDVVSGALVWYGLRAYSAATAGTKVANICNASDANCADINSTSGGNFDVTTATGSPLNCGGAGGTCTVKILYDQIGGSACGGNCDLSNSTIANRPTLSFSCIGSLPCMVFASASSQTIKRGAPNTFGAQSQPFTISVVGFQTSNVTGGLLTASGGNGTSFRSTPGVGLRATTDFNVSMANSTWYAIQGVANGASSVLYINGTSNSGSAGTSGYASGNNPQFGNDDFSEFLNGKMVEGGIWPSGFSGTQQSNMNSNQRTYWGF